MKRLFVASFILVALLSIGLVGVSAQDEMSPMVAVSDQLSLDGTVWIDEAYSEGPGFIVIHQVAEDGSVGPGIGVGALPGGYLEGMSIEIDAHMATGTLMAMLHTDDSEVGTYEFGTVEGADLPLAGEGDVVAPMFALTLLHAHDQFVTDGTFTVSNALMSEAGFVVIHEDNEGAPGPVLGVAPLTAGLNSDVVVTLEGEVTSAVWPMLHVDTGEAGVYEFGTVEGADGPVVVDEEVATTWVSTVPNMNIADQAVIYGDNSGMEAGAMMIHVHSVLSEGPGFLVIHADNAGAPGPVLGTVAVADGYNEEIEVEISGEVTPIVFPMLHVDTGEVGTYEFGTVEGADGPVSVDGEVLTFPINIAPALILDESGSLDADGYLYIAGAVIDAPGWIAVHADNGGEPGEVIGTYRLLPGATWDIYVMVDPAKAGTQVFPMLHYDTGEAGVYEFGAVEGADAPVFVSEAVIFAPLTVTAE